MEKKKIEFKKHKISDNDDAEKIEKKIKKEKRDEQVESDLMKIYCDDNGEMSNLSKIKVKKRRPFIVSLFFSLLFISIVSFLVYGVYNYINNQKGSSFVLDVNINAPSKIVLGEVFFYEIECTNNSNNTLENINLKLNYPANFIYIEAYPSPDSNNSSWEINSISPGASVKIKVKGLIINKEGLNNLLSLEANYQIAGFSSYFKKEFFYSVSVSSSPFLVNLDFFSTALVGEEYLLKFSLKDFKPLIESDMFLTLSSSGNLEFSLADEDLEEDEKNLKLEQIDDSLFKISFSNNILESPAGSYDFYLKYKVLDRLDDLEKISWQLKYLNESGSDLVFLERDFSLAVIKSDLHLNLLINEDSGDQAVSFGQNLEYTINYANKGDKKMKDLIIMAVLESDFLNWKSFKDSKGGKINRRTITWTSREIPALKELDPGQEGSINFSIDVADFKGVSYGQELKLESYAQFTIGNIEELGSDKFRVSDNKSNTIISKINSNFTAQEEIRYFDDDNIPVGSGPLPPQVGEKSSFRVYWTVNNSLHELKDLQAELVLPEYINWEDKYNLSAGEIFYDLSEHKIFWNLARLPLGVDEVKIQFDISIIPSDFENNKILILSPGSDFKALDAETNSWMEVKTDIKTTKLEDDSIANLSSDGRIK